MTVAFFDTQLEARCSRSILYTLFTEGEEEPKAQNGWLLSWEHSFIYDFGAY